MSELSGLFALGAAATTVASNANAKGCMLNFEALGVPNVDGSQGETETGCSLSYHLSVSVAFGMCVRHDWWKSAMALLQTLILLYADRLAAPHPMRSFRVWAQIL